MYNSGITIDKIINEIKKFFNINVDIRKFTNDSSHSILFLITDESNNKYICKVIYDTALSAISNCVKYEYNALNIAYQQRLSPKPIYLNESLNLIIMEYIDNVPYDKISFESILVRLNLAEKLSLCKYYFDDFRKTHCDFEEDFKYHKYLLKEKDSWRECVDDIKRIEKIFINCEQFCMSKNYLLRELPLILSHNDLVGDNVLHGKDGNYYIIDFETVGISKPDYIIGQLAVDAKIDWHLHGTKAMKLMDLYDKLTANFKFSVPYDLFIARIIERLIQNSVYALRQINLKKNADDKEYVNRKIKVLKYCLYKLENSIDLKL